MFQIILFVVIAVASIISCVLQAYALWKSYVEFCLKEQADDRSNSPNDGGDSRNDCSNHSAK